MSEAIAPGYESGTSCPALEVYGLRAGYGRVEVIHGVDLVVPRASVVALMGPNGAGKTTLLNVVAGIVPATSGCVHVAGLHVNDVATEVLAKAGVCSVPEARGTFPNLTVAENLRVFSHAAAVPYREMVERTFVRFPVLRDRRSQLAGTLSGGERQMLALSRALATDPAVLLVDELSMGLAPLIVRNLYGIVRQLAAEGISVLLVEQFARTALEVADYAYVMRLGHIEAHGRPEDLGSAVADVYLGGAQ